MVVHGATLSCLRGSSQPPGRRMRSSSSALPNGHRCFADLRPLADVLPPRDFFVFVPTRSGSLVPPVSRFHSSKVSLEIFPSTRSSANFRRCAWLLNGMNPLPFAGHRRGTMVVIGRIGRSPTDNGVMSLCCAFHPGRSQCPVSACGACTGFDSGDQRCRR
jgi:hypothetical protein